MLDECFVHFLEASFHVAEDEPSKTGGEVKGEDEDRHPEEPVLSKFHENPHSLPLGQVVEKLNIIHLGVDRPILDPPHWIVPGQSRHSS